MDSRVHRLFHYYGTWKCSLRVFSSLCLRTNMESYVRSEYIPGKRSFPVTSETLSTRAATPPVATISWANSGVCLQTSRATEAAFLLTIGSMSFSKVKILGNISAATITCKRWVLSWSVTGFSEFSTSILSIKFHPSYDLIFIRKCAFERRSIHMHESTIYSKDVTSM